MCFLLFAIFARFHLEKSEMNKEKKLVGGIIGRTGRGAYGHKLDLGFYRSESIKIGAVADENSSGLREAMNRLNCQNGYSDWRKMIFEESLDFVVVAPRFVDCHEEMVITCLEADLHVYCEKPLAQDLAQADRMVAAAAARGLVLGNALPWRIEPRLNQVRKIIRDGNIGAIKHVSAECKCDKRGGVKTF